MKLLLTKAQLLEEWQLRSFPEPVNSGCSVVQTGGVDIDNYMSARMDDWYSNLLASASLDLLAPVEMCDGISATLYPDGTARFQLPEEVVRVVSMSLDGLGPIPVVTDLRGVAAFSSGSVHRYRSSGQRAVALIDGDEVCIRPRIPFTVAPAIVSLKAIVDVEGEYRLDSKALALITPESMYKY